jgi:fucose permease
LAAASMPVSDATYWLVSAGLLLTGLGWGAVEAASNPLITTLFPQEKTHRLNILHAWWPAGIVVGGLSGVAMGAFGLSWQLNLFLLLIPGIVLAGLALRTEFPVTERVASGVSYSEMFGELKRQPMFLLWLVCMLMTASAELAPGQWVDLALSRVVGMDGILLLVYISALMFVMRHFAGPIVERVSSVGLLWISSILAVIGLYGLGRADSPATAFAAATVWGMGVCFMWPTMLANISERFPRGGALFLGLIGFCGGMAIQFVLPQLGAIFDRAKIEAAGGVDNLATLSGPELDEVLRYASVESFSAVALIPLALIPIFGFIWWRDKRSA